MVLSRHQLGAAEEGEADALDVLVGAGQGAGAADGRVHGCLAVVLAVAPLVKELGVGLQAARLHLLSCVNTVFPRRGPRRRMKHFPRTRSQEARGV